MELLGITVDAGAHAPYFRATVSKVVKIKLKGKKRLFCSFQKDLLDCSVVCSGFSLAYVLYGMQMLEVLSGSFVFPSIPPRS